MPSPSPGSRRRTTRTRSGRSLDRPFAALLLALAAGCGGASTEHQLLTRFFEASRQYDRSILESFASVAVNPRTDGTVQRFEIEDVHVESPVRETVDVRTSLRTPAGEMVERRMRMTFERSAPEGRWRITAIDSR